MLTRRLLSTQQVRKYSYRVRRRITRQLIALSSLGALREIQHCTQRYLVNKCTPETRIPHMEATCREWEHCMNQDPRSVGRARVAAETFAQVVNSFVEEISWKTLVRFP